MEHPSGPRQNAEQIENKTPKKIIDRFKNYMIVEGACRAIWFAPTFALAKHECANRPLALSEKKMFKKVPNKKKSGTHPRLKFAIHCTVAFVAFTAVPFTLAL
jgi:hypothetical protein